MNYICVCIVTTLLFTSYTYAGSQIDIKTLSELPENQIDIGRAALVLAKEIFPGIDIDIYSTKIDNIVTEIKKLTRGSVDPDYRIRALNTYLYKVFCMQYDLSDPYVKNRHNRYINGILDNHKGSCSNMPLLYLAVAQRLGYPVYAVTVPKHIFLRYVDSRLEMKNIEATSGGGYSPDEEYIATLKISSKALANGTYLKTLTYREYLGILIEQNGIYWGIKGNNIKAIYYLETAIKLNPRAADSIKSLGVAYKTQSKQCKKRFSKEEYKRKANVCFVKARQLGLKIYN